MVFMNMTRYLDMGRLPWMIYVDPKQTHMYPYKREAKGDLTTHGKEEDVKVEQRKMAVELAVIQPLAWECWWSREPGRVKNPPLKSSGA